MFFRNQLEDTSANFRCDELSEIEFSLKKYVF